MKKRNYRPRKGGTKKQGRRHRKADQIGETSIIPAPYAEEQEYREGTYRVEKMADRIRRFVGRVALIRAFTGRRAA